MANGSLYAHGFARVAACTIISHLADPQANAGSVLGAVQACDGDGVALAVFPELALSGYAIEDLLLQDAVLDAVAAGAAWLVEQSRALRPLILVGAPVRFRNRLYNCALAIQGGRLLGIVPKLYPPNYREFYEHRHFASGVDIGGAGCRDRLTLTRAVWQGSAFCARAIVPGPDRSMRRSARIFGCRCPPSSVAAALAGATILGEPVGEQHHDWQERYPPPAVPITVGPLRRRLHLRCRGSRANRRRTSPGTARPRSMKTASIARRVRTLPRGVHRPPMRRCRSRSAAAGANAAGYVRRQCARVAGPRRRSALIAFRLDPPAGDLGLKRDHRALSVRPGRSRRASLRIVSRPTTSRLPALCSASGRSSVTQGRHWRCRAALIQPTR